MTDEPAARLFFALWPSDAMQAALANAVAAMVREADGRAVPAKNFHITLAFLGSVPRRRVETLHRVAAQVAQAFNPCDLPIALTLDTLEHWRKPQILCATASAIPPRAADLAGALKRALAAEGFVTDLKTLELDFRPHVTLVRKVRHPIGPIGMAPVFWGFSRIALVESQGGARGSEYSVVASFELGTTASLEH
jgi:RNA 2',3'-cyclic 3'-phosphodiesterase